MSRCLIFDLDGTLVDSLPGIENSLNRALALHHLSGHTREAVRGFIGDGSRILIQRALGTTATPELIDSVEAAFKDDYAIHWPSGTPVFPGITQALLQLAQHDWQLAVLSNKPHPFTTAIVEALFPMVNFHCVLGQRPGVPHKPDPTGLRDILAKTSCSPEKCWLIGDSTIDLATARHGGVSSMAVTWGYHQRDALLAHSPNALIDQPEQLVDFFTRI